MGKLGKKARKFAKKNLQSVFKRKRKLKSMFKKKGSKRDEHDAAENREEDQIEKSIGRDLEGENVEDVALDAVFGDESDVVEDDSESDGYLSEDSGVIDSYENGTESSHNDVGADNNGASDLSVQNREILLELTQKRKKLEKLKKKDPEFSKFLESYENGLEKLRDEENYSDEENTSDDDTQNPSKGNVNSSKDKLLTSSALNSLCQLVKEQQSISALTSLLNGYRVACHYGTEPSGLLDVGSCCGLQDSSTFSKILIFMLQEADNIFRGMLGISRSSCKKETILELKNTSKWKTMKPLIKSYLRSTLFLLNQITDSEMLAFSLVRLRASVIFFAAFRPLLQRLIKIAVHLWVTGEGALASYSFLFIKDVASVFSSDCFNSCLIRTYKAYIGHCKFVDPDSSKHVQFLRTSFVELCSQDLQNSSSKAMVCTEQLSKILQMGLRTKKKAKCVSSVIELLAMHFAQWSYHITFPELATIPLIRLKKFHETTTIETFRRVVKRFIDQVEQNMEFIRRKRDEVAFSPKDHQSVESFLQFEKSSANTTFTQYYKSMIEKAASRSLVLNQKISSLQQKKLKGKKRQLPNKGAKSEEASEERKADLLIEDGRDGKSEKKRRTKD
ncbi:Nucleolar complex protein 2 [Corchorus olitorius]|uniref:Nucleolar complex protein 2 n=1 Tax=Corchorus olitorius TaxID=93759 RepID=A0A1R3KKX7_9ROSI|nr:Nucleolar complex protein 2 [Corchorus olitorius]